MKQEQGLSEVIGFLMIIALLGILFSMYLLYIVPLQGRDSEISHMNKVKEQFTGITLDINSLIVNEKLNYPIQRVISLGSGQEGSTGALSIFPVQSYFGSSGTLSVDSRDPNPELGSINFNLNATANKPEKPHNADFFYNIDPSDTDTKINIDPHHFFLNYYVKDPVNSSDVIYINASNVNATNWSVIARVIDRYDKNYVNITNYTNFPGDLAITIKKGGHTTIDNLTVYKYVEKNKYYAINLYDWGYGLADVLGDINNITYRVNDAITENNIAEGGPFSIGQVIYPEKLIPTNYENIPITTSSPLSMFSFQSNNKYWINQEYQYQWGAAFVNQTDGTALTFLPPVNIKREDGIIHVDLTDVDVKTHSDSIDRTSISGTQNNPVIITLSDLKDTINGYKLLEGVSNSKYLLITASGFPEYERNKWKGVFSTILENAKREGLTEGKDIVITNKPLNAGIISTSLLIAWDGTPGYDLSEIVGRNNNLEEVIAELDHIPENYLKISYKRADISFSLYNLGQF